MFNVKNQIAKLKSVNPRPEFHGDDTVTAVDLKVEMRLPNTVLGEFDKSLKQSLYKKAEDGQQDLDLEENEALTALRYPFFDTFRLSKTYEGYEGVIHFGTGGTSDISLDDCKLAKVTLLPQDGGTVVVGMSIQTHVDDDSEIGKLCKLAQREIELSLTPPDYAPPAI